MKRPGVSSPSSGLCQRTSASAPTSFFSERNEEGTEEIRRRDCRNVDVSRETFLSCEAEKKSVCIWCGSNQPTDLTESSKSPASITQSNKQWVGTCLYQEWYKPLLISCEAAIRLWHIIRRGPLAGRFLVILQVAKLGPVSRAAGMDCEYPLWPA